MRRLDLLHFPSIVKCIPNLLLGNSPRPLGPWLLVGETKEVQRSANLKDFRKTPHERQPFFVAERVEQAAVDSIVSVDLLTLASLATCCPC